MRWTLRDESEGTSKWREGLGNVRGMVPDAEPNQGTGFSGRGQNSANVFQKMFTAIEDDPPSEQASLLSKEALL